MHIAIVCRGLDAGGSVAHVALRQAWELERHAKVTLVRVDVPDLHWLRRLRHVPDELAFARAARRALRALQPDFVLAHGHAASYLAARHAGVPHGLFVHGDISDRPAGTYDARLTAFYRWVTPRAYRAADVVFVLAPKFAEIAARSGAKRVEVVPNGVDDLRHPERSEGSQDARSSHLEILRSAQDDGGGILYVGRLALEKGVDVLLDAISRLDVDLTIAGTGPLEAQLRERVSSRVTFLGHVPREELGALYARHRIFCAPSRSEPFGLVITEALACGLPVVATNVGGIPTLVEHERNGLLVPPDDVDALANAIARLMNDDALRQRLAANAAPSVAHLQWPAIGDRMFEVIRTMRP